MDLCGYCGVNQRNKLGFIDGRGDQDARPLARERAVQVACPGDGRNMLLSLRKAGPLEAC
jgi:hypothetical protein